MYYGNIQTINKNNSIKTLQKKIRLQSWTKIIWTTAKNGVVPDTTMHNQFKRPFAGSVGELYYIYKDLRLRIYDFRSNESRDHYQEDGYLVPSPRCGFCFQAVFKL